jgi:hypothetical protein
VKRSGKVAVEYSRKQLLSRKSSFATAIGVEIMLASPSTQYTPAMFAGKDRTHRMPSKFSATSAMNSMCMASAAAASALIIGTGVLTSVSLFVVVLFATVLLLVSLVVLISLSGLTGLISRLVGLLIGLDPGTV